MSALFVAVTGTRPTVAQVDGAVGACPPAPNPPAAVTVAWDDINAQPAAWYGTAQALTVAANVLYYQNGNGGWPKNIDMTVRTAPRGETSTIDNGATSTQMVFLANVAAATGCATYSSAFLRGLDYLLGAQYPNGGWPQVFPIEQNDYSRHITYNDGAMTNVLSLLRDVGNRVSKYTFVDAARADRSSAAVARGIDCILRSQIVVNGVKVGWCAQHDAMTLAPTTARSYELPSISGYEGAEVWRFLMTVENPSPAIVEAVQGAAAWFERAKLTGIRTERFVAPNGEEDVRVVTDPAAPPIWARFYEISTSVPFFCGRDGVKKATLAEIEQERRAGYNYYGDWPATLLGTTYPAWVARWATPRPDAGPPPVDAGAPDGRDGATSGPDGGAPSTDAVGPPLVDGGGSGAADAGSRDMAAIDGAVAAEGGATDVSTSADAPSNPGDAGATDLSGSLPGTDGGAPPGSPGGAGAGCACDSAPARARDGLSAVAGLLMLTLFALRANRGRTAPRRARRNRGRLR